MSTSFASSRGCAWPLGATLQDDGVNFSLYSRHATAVDLLLFAPGERQPSQIISLNTRHHQTSHHWHVFLHGVSPGQRYGWRVHGPWAPERGLRFDPEVVLLDPYARRVLHEHSETSSFVSLVTDPHSFDWEGVQPPRHAPSERVIYELHVRGYTQSSSSHTDHPGTFLGLTEKIPYLQDLGVTTVELLPVFSFDDVTPCFFHEDSGAPIRDFWGYNPISFFSPHRGFHPLPSCEVDAFRHMVRAFHQAGIEVFLDVVFNHTGEADEHGPTHSLRGIDNPTYYLLHPQDPSRYANHSGVGNTLHCHHPVTRRMILDALRYWVEVMHVDGFRFDLASVLTRDSHGTPQASPPLLWEIESDPILQNTTLIAEPWDASGLYQVGSFPGDRWSEWNGCFRDDVRQFWRGDHGFASRMSKRMLGSPDLYESSGRLPSQSINFITCHDGFTLRDLVSYNQKHNLANGESGRDGHEPNFSFNHGIEGPTSDPNLLGIRLQQSKNMLATLFLAQGTPMLLGGDEFGRTQHGNNNAWCQDHETGWVDWTLLPKHHELFTFVRGLINFRARHPSLRRDRFLLGADAPPHLDPSGFTRVQWHGTEPGHPDWSDGARTLSYTLTESEDDVAIHIIMNAHTNSVAFRLPPLPSETHWLTCIDTHTSPGVFTPGNEPSCLDVCYMVQGRSLVVLAQSPGHKPARTLPW